MKKSNELKFLVLYLVDDKIHQGIGKLMNILSEVLPA